MKPLNILVNPISNWIYSPPSHVQDLSEQLAVQNNVYGIYYYLPTGKNSPYTIPKKVKLIKLPLQPRVTNTALQRFLNAICYLMSLSNICRNLDVDVIINEDIFSAMALKYVPKRILKIFDFSDYFPDSTLIYIRNKHMIPIVSLCTWSLILENIRTSQVCISPSQALLNISRKHGCKNTFFFPNSVDLKEYKFSQESRIHVRKLFAFSEDDFILAHVGVIEPWIDFNLIFEGMHKTINSEINLKLLIIGSSITDYDKRIKREVKEYGLQNNVFFTGYVKRKDIPVYLSSADAGIIAYVKGQFNSNVRLPVKFFQYSAIGLPILSTPLDEITVLKPNHVLFFQDADSFKKAISFLTSNKHLHNIYRSSATSFMKKYDLNILSRKFNEYLRQRARSS